ncbi:Mediator of RNA polymerase II transcription subunit 17 [Exophiala dermatitidis]
MSDSKTISLLIPSEAPAQSQDWSTQIQKIVAQKGHFRHVTERGLVSRTKDKAVDSQEKQAANEIQGENEDETRQKHQESLWKGREQMLERLSYAQNEILCALDFISLLISKQSVPAQSSMSPALKEAVPVGTLAARMLKPKPLPSSVQQRLALTSEGWRLQSFRSASKKLSEASSRLRSDAERQTEYWAQIAGLTAAGWAVSRVPRDSKAVGVHFGFPESAPQFRDRGFALLRQSEDGSVTLDKHALRGKRKWLHVYVSRDGVRTAAFSPKRPTKSHSESISEQLTELRDSMFEEELFYEICREARIVANQGVSTRAQAVDLEVGDGCRISLLFSEKPDTEVAGNADDNTIAEFVATSLRLLLTAAHEQNLAKRSHKPLPMTIKPRPLPEYTLIRPILTHLRHKAEAASFWGDCRILLRPFVQGGVPVSIVPAGSGNDLSQPLHTETPSSILSGLMHPAQAACKVTLTGERIMTVDLHTFLGPPLHGSRYETSSLDFGFSHLPHLHHETKEAVMLFIRRVLLLDLVKHTQDLALESQDVQNSDHDTLRKWTLCRPHHGEFALYRSGEVVEKMKIGILPESVNIRWSSLDTGSTSRQVIWSWTASGCTKADGAEVWPHVETTFDEAIGQIIKG